MGAHGSPSRRPVAQGDGVHVIPIAPVLAHYGVDLNESRWGNTAVLCPVHNERRPSLSVNVEKGVAFCFACDFKGTAIHLIMAMEGCSRADALDRAEKILRAGGHAVPERPGGRYRRPGVPGEPGARAGGGRTVPAGRRYVPPGRT
ncbi:hypothetical protein DVK44_29465 [Streptomyces paludis]|uniref:Zinc finger CHC2-type domain-containing protein n=1 Tax=Streptomyces paludis TaxID=2282738 RepID=A0A345HWQ8_9ACTN|nr:hypothetical protein DVK44_29465 [Streptomyces paludis]